MTKNAEIAWIDKLIEHYGDGTYLGQFLKDYKADIIWAIRADFSIATAISNRVKVEVQT